MGLMRVVTPDTEHTIQLPQEFVDRLGIRAGRELGASAVPFTSARIQPEAVQALQRMPTDE